MPWLRLQPSQSRLLQDGVRERPNASLPAEVDGRIHDSLDELVGLGRLAHELEVRVRRARRGERVALAGAGLGHDEAYPREERKGLRQPPGVAPVEYTLFWPSVQVVLLFTTLYSFSSRVGQIWWVTPRGARPDSPTPVWTPR